MAYGKKQRPTLRTSPRARARFAWLNKADTKYDTDGVYKVDAVVEDEADRDRMIDVIEQVQEVARQEAESKKTPGKRPKPADLPIGAEIVGKGEDAEETGHTQFRFKSKASGTTKDGKRWERKLPLFDAKGKPTDVEVGGGSIIKISYTAQPWVNPKLEYGVKLQIEAVQVIDLVTFGQRDAGDYGFGEEDGFEGNGVQEQEDCPFDAEDTAPTKGGSGAPEPDDF